MQSIVDSFAIEETPSDVQTGDWFIAFADDAPNSTEGPFASELLALQAAKTRFAEDSEVVEDEMLILRIAKRLKLFRRIEIEVR